MTPAPLALLPWQQEALDGWERAGRRGIVEAVTGTGKTRVGLAAIAATVRSGGRAVVLVPTTELQDQWHRELDRFLPDVRVGLVGGGQRPFGVWQVALAVVNSAASPAQDPALASADLLVADECHRYGAPSYGAALRPSHACASG